MGRVHFGRLSAALGIGAVAALGTHGAASAHVVVGPAEAAAGESALLTFAFSHGCDGSATSEVRIQIPESIPSVAPTINANWDVDKVMVELDEPIEGAHGAQLTERVSEVVYTAQTPVPDGYRDTFVLSLTAPDTPGETIYFPTIQTCEEGETAWIEIPAEGENPDDLEAPAPAVAVVEAESTESGDGH